MTTKISKPVGPWDDPVIQKEKGNVKDDVVTVQRLLIAASRKLKKPDFDPGTPDGRIAKDSKKSKTLRAIAAFQRGFLRTPDQRVDVGGKTWRKLTQYGGEPMILHVNGTRLILFCREMMDGHCAYGLGAKATPLSTKPSEVTKIDCSGFVRYLLYQVSDGRIRIPDGSWHQDKWFADNGFLQIDYAECAKSDGYLRLGYFSGSPGHIWFVWNGKTIESRGGRGPDRRNWDAKALSRVQRSYVIAEVSSGLAPRGWKLA